jgi:hypothetical protein
MGLSKSLGEAEDHPSSRPAPQRYPHSLPAAREYRAQNRDTAILHEDEDTERTPASAMAKVKGGGNIACVGWRSRHRGNQGRYNPKNKQGEPKTVQRPRPPRGTALEHPPVATAALKLRVSSLTRVAYSGTSASAARPSYILGRAATTVRGEPVGHQQAPPSPTTATYRNTPSEVSTQTWVRLSGCHRASSTSEEW